MLDRNELVSKNINLVYSIARKYTNKKVEFDDLVQEGSIGLIIAARRYDPARNTKFSTVATWWVKKYVREAAMNSGLIKIPLNIQLQENRQIRENIRHCAQEGGRSPYKRLGFVYIPEIEEVINKRQLYKNKYENVEDKTDKTLKLIKVYKSFYKLSYREKRIISICCYGEGLKKAADEFGISRQRVDQIYRRAIEKIKKEIRN